MARNFVSMPDFPIAKTEAGKIRGFELDGIITFLGIPYATARRFHPAQPVEKWDGVRDATNYGVIAPAYGSAVYEGTVTPGELLTPHRYWPENENCQNLNVWTNTLDQNAKKPVMVWFHGGGFSDGSAIELEAYDGDALCRNGDVVVVTVNHRLHLLGYLDLSAFGQQYHNSVNAGITDLVEALTWVQHNISAFGGDPDNVTIFGQSGGGGKVYTLMQTPQAAGLFHKAIIMSGTDNFDRGLDHTPIVKEMLRVLNIPESKVEQLETVSYSRLMRAYCRAANTIGAAINWGPVPNGYYLGHPVDVGFSEYGKKVPMIVGTVIAEFGGVFGTAVTRSSSEKDKLAAVKKLCGDHSDKLIAAFQKAYPDTDLSVLPKLDVWVRPRALQFMDAHVKSGSAAPAYLYQFGLVFDVNDGTPAWHCSDIPFVFHSCHNVPCANINDVTDCLENEMFGAAVAFARTGDPNHDGLPKWLPYTSESRETMVFDRKTALRTDYDTVLLQSILDCLPKNAGAFAAMLPPDDGSAI